MFDQHFPLPYSAHRHFPEDQLVALRRQRAESLVAASQKVVRSSDGSSLAGLTTLAWDSRLLERSAGRVDFILGPQIAELAEKVIEGAEELGITHLSARIESDRPQVIQTLEDQGFRTVDGLVTFGRTSSHHLSDTHHSFTIRLAQESDRQEVENLGRTAFTIDRFHNDPLVTPDQANGLYAEWARNSVGGGAADAVVVAEDDNGLLGFVTCKLVRDTIETLGSPVGTIPLVATNSRHRRGGVARAMTLAAVNWFHDQGAEICEVGTQLANIPACRLYESCGFRMVGSNVSLRLARQ